MQTCFNQLTCIKINHYYNFDQKKESMNYAVFNYLCRDDVLEMWC